ncbi:SubName: Full=Related to MRPS9-mitochondrial ribosomal protein, small subunit {ECO:0000313/EMBL:CCA72006.1} [Serendipita indica DSM 11827]|uniref:Related to MRPS9-mitochondrial ribosomal protein, small subunit n=1 Tax=Serendipita indica (strain DSM 11827) TaxID=1109443 RepID=G4TL13_SERID|nr:SubName: Full=Related to MRPS9-mitochondrial ribosomal protein, small subunit {ECO:0000313/EMBL:CCA72006.1} [Serendipita indica DSM 11827]CCA72006.1 related to MRPS9-mitochondrial ribosomal protein, small subunit [Serendipita indica DSM 11827]
MLRVRPALRVAFKRVPRRAMATDSIPFIPPESTKRMIRGRGPVQPMPESPTFFSGHSAYLDRVYNLEKQLNEFTSLMHRAHITPLPKVAEHHIGHVPSYWRDVNEMYQILGKAIKGTQYRRLISVLTQLNKLRRVALLCGREDIAQSIEKIITPYEKSNKAVLESLSTGRKRPEPDEFGRVYAVGRRKTSSARVWVIKVKDQEFRDASDRGSVPVASCIVNGIPAAQYFTHVVDRERLFRPLKLTGLLSSYNVFALVRGGGTTGQAEAIAVGMAKALEVLQPNVKPIIKQAKLMRRDPRMVERKKTNLAKARKAYTWVKR